MDAARPGFTFKAEKPLIVAEPVRISREVSSAAWQDFGVSDYFAVFAEKGGYIEIAAPALALPVRMPGGILPAAGSYPAKSNPGPITGGGTLVLETLRWFTICPFQET